MYNIFERMVIMEWANIIRTAINYIETNLFVELTVKDVADHVYISEAYLQRGFKIIIGYTVMEYIRYRKLSEAAKEVIFSTESIGELAEKYGYRSTNSFVKAFVRFHNASPVEIKNGCKEAQFVSGVDIISKCTEYGQAKIKRKYPITVVGFRYKINEENAGKEISKIWSEFRNKCQNNTFFEDSVFTIIKENNIGEFGILLKEKTGYSYIIGGKYCGGKVADDMELFELSSEYWCIKTLSGLVYNVIPDIYSNDYIINNLICDGYVKSGDIVVEWYEDTISDDIKFVPRSAIWIPVIPQKSKNKMHAISNLQLVFSTIIFVYHI